MTDERSTHRPCKRCPQCRSSRIARSHQQGIWGRAPFRWLGVRIYRCTDCWRRFSAISTAGLFPSLRREAALPTPLPELEPSTSRSAR